MAQQSHSWVYIQRKWKHVLSEIPHVHSIITHKSQDMEITQCLLMGEWRKKVWRACAMEYLFRHGKEGNPAFVTTWMKFEGIMLSEINQSKTNIVWYHLDMESKRESEVIETE